MDAGSAAAPTAAAVAGIGASRVHHRDFAGSAECVPPRPNRGVPFGQDGEVLVRGDRHAAAAGHRLRNGRGLLQPPDTRVCLLPRSPRMSLGG